MTDEQLRKIYFPIAEAWKLIRESCDATGTPVECFKVQEQAKDIFENQARRSLQKKSYPQRLTRLTGLCGKTTRKEPASGRGKGIPGFLKKWKDRKRSNASYTETRCRIIRNTQYRRRS